MRITISNWLGTKVVWAPTIKAEALAPFIASERIKAITNDVSESDFHISWAGPAYGSRTATMESGFFHDSLHLDMFGLFASCSLFLIPRPFIPPMDAVPLVLAHKVPSKFPQVKNRREWTGVVLALQNPKDRSVLLVSSVEGYYQFVENACKYYKEKLFLKLHPWNSGDVEKRFREIAAAHGCTIDRCDTSVIEKCSFVLIFNSTFAVDCLMRGIPVAQFAPGYFWQVPPVIFTNRRYPDWVPLNAPQGREVCNFLLWKYCLPAAHSTERMVSIFEHFATSTELFPLRQEDSYAQWLLDGAKPPEITPLPA